MPNPIEIIGSLARIFRSAEAQKRISELEAENEKMKSRQQEDKDNPLTFSEASQLYFDSRGLRYCVGCRDEKGIRAHLLPHHANMYKCSVCDKMFSDRAEPPPERRKGGWDPLADD